MKLAVLCFSQAGEELARRLAVGLEGLGYQVSVSSKSKHAQAPMEESLGQWTRARFADSDGIIYIGALGIAVRAIAPYIVSKKTDPAVVVLDDTAKYAISVLSGHLGGANELTLAVSGLVGAAPVITTATDRHEKLAPDVFAKKNGCVIDSMAAAKNVAAALLTGAQVGLISAFPADVKKAPPEVDLYQDGNAAAVMVISPFQRDYEAACRGWEETLWLIPRALTLGIGCKRGTDAARIEAAVNEALAAAGADRRAVAGAGTIDLKADEKGLLDFCQKWELPLKIYTAEELEAVPGDFHGSEFVKKTTGVDNVCERSAKLCASQLKADEEGENPFDETELLTDKFCKDGVTVAIGIRKWRIRFE